MNLRTSAPRVVT